MNRHFLPQARSNARRRAIGLALPPPKLKPRKCSSDSVAIGVAKKNPAAPQPDFYLSNDVASGEAGRRQHVALPQRATPIFSLRLSMPTAPITTCLPIT